MRRLNNNKGYTTVFIALAMPVIIGVLGFCLDGSLMLYYDAKLATAVKFASISASSVNKVVNGNLEITADNSFVDGILQTNMEDSTLIDFTITPSKKNECTVKASFEVPFVFMKIFGIESKTLVESYTARRYL